MKSEHKELTQYFSQQTELIKEIHQQLTEHLDQRFTIAELSKQYLINTSTLKEIFKAVYGQPIATYMKEFRVRQAMKLLRETDASIADIANQVGYETQGKISKALKDVVQVLEAHGGGRIVERCQQILLHVPHRGNVFCQRIQHETDVVGVQLFQPTAYHLGGLIISGDSQHLAFGGTGVHKQVYDLVDSVLLVRAEPEKQLDLQRLIKIILKLFPDAPGIEKVRIVPLCLILISLICLRFWLFQSCAFGSTRIAVWAILHLRFWQARGKVLDVDQAGSAQTTALALDEVNVLQLPEQLDRLMLGTAEGFLHLPDSVDDIHPALLIHPAILYRQAHAVQQDAVQCPGIRGKLPETAVLKESFRNAEVGKQFARLTIEVVVTHDINGSSSHGLRHLSYT